MALNKEREYIIGSTSFVAEDDIALGALVKIGTTRWGVATGTAGTDAKILGVATRAAKAGQPVAVAYRSGEIVSARANDTATATAISVGDAVISVADGKAASSSTANHFAVGRALSAISQADARAASDSAPRYIAVLLHKEQI